MSIKDLFNQNKRSDSVLAEKDPTEIVESVESFENIGQKISLNQRFVPLVDFSDPKSFVKFGSAENYYSASIANILNEYPYDGSRAEVNEFLNNSTFLDLYLLEKEYPRTNGYAIFSSNGWGTRSGDLIEGYGLSSNVEYISLVGGPQTASSGMVGKTLASTFKDANIYQSDVYSTSGVQAYDRVGTRDSNLKFDLARGVSTEFWLNKGSWLVDSALTEKEVIFDLWNGAASSSNGYGRLLVFLTGTSDGQDPFRIHLASGSNVLNASFGGSTVLTSTLADTWNHVAITLQSSSAQIEGNLYLNGQLIETKTSTAINFSEVTGNLKANIAALQTSPSGNIYHGTSMTGYGKLSGSLDEFRYWKSYRSSREIAENYRFQVGGGTNTDVSNTELGVYYKFNEGIVGESTIDSSVLDYSGRVTNGSWVGYPGSSARSTGSAIVLANASDSEYKDPIVRATHTDVTSLRTRLVNSGSEYDTSNNSSIYYSLPSWIVDEDRTGEGGENLLQLTQIMSSYFDEVCLSIQSLNTLKNKTYTSSSVRSPLAFNETVLESQGFMVSPIFSDVTLVEKILNHDSRNHFEMQLNDIKNQIYNNIYNNLVYIYKSKGNEKSFRNLFRCFGIDDELVNISMYGNNVRYTYDNRYTFSSTGKKFVDFNDPDRFASSVYHRTDSDLTYVSGSLIGHDLQNIGFTGETEVIFPKPQNVQSESFFQVSFLSSSLFGFHSPNTASALSSEYTFQANDISAQLYSVRTSVGSSDAFFLLSASFGTGDDVIITSDVYPGVYDNTKWNFAVSVKPDKFGLADEVAGTSGGTYTLQLYAVRKELDIVVDSFTLTESLSNAQGKNIASSPKRYYAGAHRTNFTGTVQTSTDVKIGSVRHWMLPLDTGVIDVHAQNPLNYGTLNPSRNAFLNQSVVTGTYIPEIETLALHWDFQSVTSSDSSGEFVVNDITSGSANALTRFGSVSKATEYIYQAIGDNFPTTNTKVVSKEFINFANLNVPDELSSYDLITVTNNDIETFTRDSAPVNYYFAFEKSPYRTISKDIVNMFASIKDFSNLYHHPVQRYRVEHKDLRQLRELYFQNIGNTPDIEKYLNYYRWIDSSLSKMIRQLIPLTADTSENINTVIEEHALSRQHYRYNYPIFKEVGPLKGSLQDTSDGFLEAKVSGINELLYPWDRGSSPVTNLQSDNCLWWYARAERNSSVITSGDTVIDSQRDTFRRIVQSHVSASGPNLAQSDGTSYVGSSYSRRKFTKLYNLCISLDSAMGTVVNKVIHGGINIPAGGSNKLWKSVVNKLAGSSLSITSFEQEDGCSDNSYGLCDQTGTPPALKHIRKRFKATFGTDVQSDFSVLPFTFMSASAGVPSAGYQQKLISDFGSTTRFDINGIHQDVYDTEYEIPVQGPFTEKYVGGSGHRHVAINQYSSEKPGANNIDSDADRIEGFKINLSSNTIEITNQDLTKPRSTFARETFSKRPVNVKNIQHATSSLGTVLGNYQDPIDYLNSNGRVENDIFAIHTPFSASVVSSSYVVGVQDYTKLARTKKQNVIVNRFSSPGDPATMGDNLGGPGLDAQHAELSAYNALPYRNLAVRQPLQTILSIHSQQFGLKSGSFANSSDYDGTASFHGVNSNRRLIIHLSGTTHVTGAVHDNYFVRHPLPQSDLQYTWVTGTALNYGGFSLTGTDNVPFGYLPPDGKITSSTGFVDAVDYVLTAALSNSVQGTPFYPINLNVLTPFDTSSLLIGFASSTELTSYLNTELYSSLSDTSAAEVFNSILASRGGTFNLSTWAQIRGQDSKAMATLRKKNILTHVPVYGDEVVSFDPSGVREVKRLRNQTTYRFTEPVLDASSNPIVLSIKKRVNNRDVNAYIKIPFNNESVKFANEQLNNVLNIQTFDDTRLEQIKRLLNTPNIDTVYVQFSETVYPQKTNLGSNKSRFRNNFDNNFWRDSRVDRTAKGNLLKPSVASQTTFFSQSCWSLDAEEDFSTTTIQTGTAGATADGSKAGVLQNVYTQIHGGDLTGLRYAPLYSRKHTLGSKFSFVSPYGISVPQTASLGSIGSITDVSNSLGAAQLFAGNALWEAATQSGKFGTDGAFVSESRAPFYDTYDKFSENVYPINYDRTLIPEFRISSHISYYVNERQGDFLANNTASFDIFGINALTSSSDFMSNSSDERFYKVYSTSDLFGNLRAALRELEGEVEPASIQLKFKAIKKFVAYDGFYPSERTVDLATQFSSSYASHISFTGSNSGSFGAGLGVTARLRPITSALFSPGVLYNTIKSGIAVDYSVYTGSKEIIRIQNADITGSMPEQGIGSFGGATRYHLLGTGSNGINGMDYRVPFESLVEPANFLSNINFTDMEPHPSASMDLTASWDGNGDKLYKLMANNFLAEVADFYLENGEITSLVSEPQTRFKKFSSGSYYGMRVRLRRSMNTPRVFETSFPTPQHSIKQRLGDIGDEVLVEDFTLYSRPSSFGPPMAARRYVDTSSFQTAFEPDSLFGYNPAYTPPYYDGEAWADVVFKATSDRHTLEDIFGSSKVVCWRFDSSSSPQPAGTLYNETPYGEFINNFSMQLTSSVNILGKTSVRSVEYDPNGDPIIIKDDSVANDQIWVIQPKFETPALNFNDTGKRAITGSLVAIPTNGSESVPRGIWHQFGMIPDTPRKGIFLEVSDIDSDWLSNRGTTPDQSGTYNSGDMQSLADVVGFRKRSARIGKLAKTKKIYEAVAAIPFLEIEGQRRFFKLDKQLVESAIQKSINRNYRPPEDSPQPGSSLVDLVTKMQRYVIPPTFDFVKNRESVEPISMYVFEFSHTFDQDDLSYMWQNLAPKLGNDPEYSVSSLSHDLAGNEILSYISGGGNGNAELKWLVFKIKQKAQTSYFDKLLAENINSDPRFRNLEPKVGKRRNDTDISSYTYNWPYDFFTMIEYGKMDFNVITEPEEK